MKMNKQNKLFQGLTLLMRDHIKNSMWVTYEEIPEYLKEGYVIVNDLKKAVWEKNAK